MQQLESLMHVHAKKLGEIAQLTVILPVEIISDLIIGNADESREGEQAAQEENEKNAPRDFAAERRHFEFHELCFS